MMQISEVEVEFELGEELPSDAWELNAPREDVQPRGIPDLLVGIVVVLRMRKKDAVIDQEAG
jgi:hypothetical protein